MAAAGRGQALQGSIDARSKLTDELQPFSCATLDRMSPFDTKPTSRSRQLMSALRGEADMTGSADTSVFDPNPVGRCVRPMTCMLVAESACPTFRRTLRSCSERRSTMIVIALEAPGYRK